MKIVHNQPNSSTLINIKTGQATVISSSFGDPAKIPFVKSNGKVLIVNESGIIVRTTAIFDWDENLGLIAPSIESAVVEHANQQGNVYALAINQKGVIHASKLLVLEKDLEPKIPLLNRIPIITD